MALRIKTVDEEFMKDRSFFPLDLSSLVQQMDRLKQDGFFYVRELVFAGDKNSLWEDSEEAAQKYWLTDEWKKMDQDRAITSVQMEFQHILTRAKQYLYVSRVKLKQGNEPVVWISKLNSDGIVSSSSRDWNILDMPPFFEKLLKAVGLFPQLGSFQELSIEMIRCQADNSLFSLLYQHGYRQTKVGRGKAKSDTHTENSPVWAGEFVDTNTPTNHPDYLYIVLIQREFEEWDSNYGGENACVWRDRYLNVYAARSRESLDQIRLTNEKPIKLEALPMAEQIHAYLEELSTIDTLIFVPDNNYQSE